MNLLSRIAVATIAGACLVAPVAMLPTAQAAGRDWTVIEKGGKAKQEACKTLVDGGDAWRIYNRFDRSNDTGPRLRARLIVLKANGQPSDHVWDSGFVRKGNISDVGTVRFGRGKGLSLAMSISGDQSGKGGTLDITDIGRC